MNAQGRQHARHLCRAGCILISENLQRLTTRTVLTMNSTDGYKTWVKKKLRIRATFFANGISCLDFANNGHHKITGRFQISVYSSKNTNTKVGRLQRVLSPTHTFTKRILINRPWEDYWILSWIDWCTSQRVRSFIDWCSPSWGRSSKKAVNQKTFFIQANSKLRMHHFFKITQNSGNRGVTGGAKGGESAWRRTCSPPPKEP